MFDAEDRTLILELATSSASLDRSPKKNWVENAGGLPPYVRKLARAINKRGHSLDRSIAIALSRVKAWAAGGDDVEADTRAKAVKAVAQWEALKAKNKMKLSHSETGEEYIVLSSVGSFDTEIVRRAWERMESERHKAERQSRGQDSMSSDVEVSAATYRWIRELGTDYIVYEESSGERRFRAPYSVDANDNVYFGPARPIVQIWVDDTDELSKDELRSIARVLSASGALKRLAEAVKGL